MKVVSLWLIFLFQKEAALFSDMKKKKKRKKFAYSYIIRCICLLKNLYINTN